MSELAGKIALVTGAGQGLGKAIARVLAGEGATVICADLDETTGKRTVAEIADGGGQAQFVAVDVSREDSVGALFDRIVQDHGTLDIAVNNAGVELETGDELGAWSSAIMRRVIDINLMGVFHCMQRELAMMSEAGSGAIVNMSSVAGVTGANGKPAYTASKHGVIGLTKTAAVQYGPSGIRVNAICPSVTRTEMFAVQDIDESVMIDAHPLRRIADPSDVAEAALWLCSDRSRNVTGHTLLTDGGYMAY